MYFHVKKDSSVRKSIYKLYFRVFVCEESRSNMPSKHPLALDVTRLLYR